MSGAEILYSSTLSEMFHISFEEIGIPVGVKMHIDQLLVERKYEADYATI